MSSDAIESRVLRNLENKQKTCYNCNKRGHTKYECRQSPFISNHVEKRHEPDIDNVVVIMEGVSLADNVVDLMKHLLASLKLSKKIGPEQYELKRPWSHIHRKNDVKITFKSADTKDMFMSAINAKIAKYDSYKDFFYYYGQFVDRRYKVTVGKKDYKLVFREDLPYDLDKLYTKALEIKEQYGVDRVVVGDQGKILAHKRTFTYFWCKNTDDLERVKKQLEKQGTHKITRKRKLLRIGPVDGK